MADVTAPFGFPYPENTDLVRDGAQDIENLATGVNDQLALGFQYVGTRYYTSSGTFAKADPFGDSSFDGAKLRAIRVRLVGAGGGSGGISVTTAGRNSVAAGGGGGGYAEAFVLASALGTSETVTRGSGGAGGAIAGNGSAGGVSSFGTFASATGGAGGTSGGNLSIPNAAASVAGGIGTVGDFVASGEGSQPASLVLAILPIIGASGGSRFGAGLHGLRVAAATAASAGVSPGAGGRSGANPENEATGAVGAAGANGIVIVDVFA
jgi:hypothetical protein